MEAWQGDCCRFVENSDKDDDNNNNNDNNDNDNNNKSRQQQQQQQQQWATTNMTTASKRMTNEPWVNNKRYTLTTTKPSMNTQTIKTRKTFSEHTTTKTSMNTIKQEITQHKINEETKQNNEQ